MLLASRTRLRAVERDDVPALVRWLNDPELRSHVLMFAPVSIAAEERWYEGLLKDGGRHVFVIDAAADDGSFRPAGVCGLEKIDLRNGRALLGVFLGDPADRGRGHGREAVELLLDFGFGELRLHRVELEVFEGNLPALGLYERLGFQREGVRRESVFKGGAWLSPVVMSILDHEHRARRAGA